MTLKIIYSFYKLGEEGQGWAREIKAASNDRFTFIPFNQVGYLKAWLYGDAVKLDRLYQTRHSDLMRMYDDFEALVRDHNVDALVVCDAPPFHPDFLRKLPVYKVLYTHDDPEASYQRNIPYLHAYQHVFYVTPAYTEDMDMAEKMRYCGLVNSDFVPNGTFDFDFDPLQTEESLFTHERDIDVIFVGGFYRRKIHLLARLKQTFGSRFRWYGRLNLKLNLYMTIRSRFPCWIQSVSFQQRVRLHQRAKIGVNIHNGYSIPNLGNQRLYYLPANGVMQISDGLKHLPCVFEIGKEVVGYQDADDLIEKIKYYLEHVDERNTIALDGYKRVMREYRFSQITQRAGELIVKGMERIGWTKQG